MRRNIRRASSVASAAAEGAARAPVSGHVTAAGDPAASVRMAGPLVTDFRVHRSITFDFSRPMDEASVAAALTVDPYAALDLSWSADGRHLTVSPQGSWSPSQIYVVRIGTTARDRTGKAIATPVVVGPSDETRTLIKSGLNEGDEIIIGKTFLKLLVDPIS